MALGTGFRNSFFVSGYSRFGIPLLIASLLVITALPPAKAVAWGNGPELTNPQAIPSTVPLGAQPQKSPLLLSVNAQGPGGQVVEVITNLEDLIGAGYYDSLTNTIQDVQGDTPLFRVYEIEGVEAYLVELGIRNEYNMYRKAVTHELLRGEAVATDKWQVELPLAGNLPGSYSFRVIARNTMRHEGYAWISLNLVEDSTKPEISVQATYRVNSLTTCIGDSVAVEVEATDDATGVFCVRMEDEGAKTLFGENAELILTRQVDSNIWRVQNTVAQNVSPGVYQIRVVAMDRAGNETAETVSVNVSDTIDSFIIDLHKGWNLISVPRSLQNPAVEEVFEGLPVSQVKTMIGGDWIEVAEVHPGLGYLVEATKDACLILELKGYEVAAVPRALELGPGWNLIGYSSPTLEPLVPVSFYLGEDIKDKWTILRDAEGAEARARSTSPYVWATDSFPTVTGETSFSDTSDNIPALELGEGYWIFLTEEAALIL